MHLLRRYDIRTDRVEWTRYWGPRGEPVDGHGGYLREPYTSELLRQNAHLRPLEAFDDVRCVIALGDPGLGKSRVLEAYAAALRARRATDPAYGSDLLIAVDAPDFTTRAELVAEFRGDAIDAWRAGVGRLYVVVDSLDEAQFGVRAFINALLDALTDVPRARLWLRVGCRTAVFDGELELAFSTFFTPSNPDVTPNAVGTALATEALAENEPHEAPVHDGDATQEAAATPAMQTAAPPAAEPMLVVELAILTREAARIMASSLLPPNDDADAFLDAVATADVEHFASRPQTLKALIARRRRGAELRGTQAELYRELCQILCDPNPTPPGETQRLRLTAPQRYRVAGRVCAALLLGNKRSAWVSLEPATRPDVLSPSDVIGVEYLNGLPVTVDEGHVREALNTGLFTGAGPGELVVHRTFAEFMAADWLTIRHMGRTQLLSLLREPTDPDRHVVRPLWELAAWIAALNEPVLQYLLATQPDLLLWTEVVQLPSTQRSALVDAMLAATARNEARDRPFGMGERLARLTHDALGAQLLPVITTSERPTRERELALEIAAACAARETADACVGIALDASEPKRLRLSAAGVVASCGSPEARRALMPLALMTALDDDDDELKGSALRACWRLLSPEELFATLTPPKRPNFSGAYALAQYEIRNGLTAEYTAAAAEWLARQERHGHVMEYLFEAAFRLAVAGAREPRVRDALVTYVETCIARHRAMFEDLFGSSRDRLTAVVDEHPEIRRELIVALAARHRVDPRMLFYLTDYPPQLFRSEDVTWGIDVLTGIAPDTPERAIWVRLLQATFDPGNVEQLRAAFAHCDDRDVVAIAHGLPGQFESVEAARDHVGRERLRQQEQWRARDARAAERARANQPTPAGSRLMRLQAVLEARTSPDGASGHVEGQGTPASDPGRRWVRILSELLREDSGTQHGYLTEGAIRDLRALHGTASGDALARAAREYLDYETVPENPFPEGREMWLVRYGLFAVAALIEASARGLSDVSDETWHKWARALVPYSPVTDEEPYYERALLAITLAAPDEAQQQLVRTLASLLSDSRRWPSDPLLRVAMTMPDVVRDLAGPLASGAFSASGTERLLQWLLQQPLPIEGVDPIAIVQTLIARGDEQPLVDANQRMAPPADGIPAPATAGERSRAAQAALLIHAPSRGWDVLLPRLMDDDRARALLESAARQREVLPPSALASLSDEQIGVLFRRVLHLYRPETDPWHVGAYSPGPRDFLTRWRQLLLDTLAERRTTSAINTLERIANDHPAYEWLTQIWREAKASMHGTRWLGILPRDLMALATTPDLRLVQSEPDLLDVIVESLERYDGDLHGEWQAVAGLWNTATRNTPKSEAELSNAIARHLRSDLRNRRLVVARELVLQVGIPSAAPGLRTDIEVRAIAPGTGDSPGETIRVVIEVKGSWHPDALTAMDNQLVQDYLVRHGFRGGLYLVGFFTCAAWSDTSQRAASRRLGDIDGLRVTLDTQASELSTPMRDVRAYVLDARLPEPPPARRPPRRATKKPSGS